jgi:hypothetical protein
VPDFSASELICVHLFIRGWIVSGSVRGSVLVPPENDFYTFRLAKQA